METNEQPIIRPRPRDEDFGVRETVKKRKPSAEEIIPKQNILVIFSIIAAGVILAAIVLLIFFALKNHQRTTVNIVTTEASSEAPTLPTVAEETETEAMLPEETEAAESETGSGTEETEVPSETAETAESITETEEASAEETETSVPETQYLTPDAAGNVEVDGIIYHMEDNRAAVYKCLSQESVITLRDNINGVPVAIIYDEAFADCSSLEYLHVREGVAWIGSGVFKGCTALKELVLPDTLGELTMAAFDMGKTVTVVSHASAYAHEIADHLGFSWLEGSGIIELN